jgi:hypothetical protein
MKTHVGFKFFIQCIISIYHLTFKSYFENGIMPKISVLVGILQYIEMEDHCKI